MKITDQQGHEHFTHEVHFFGTIVKCTPDSDRRKREELGKYESMMRAAEVLAEIYSARSFGKSEFQMPER
ncbi:hypothetical protein [Lacrimispora sp.]|uniref:hypothetical protein n=1 Tax=Lacrimispora sp. TaxID=2719234 RepID=UPI00289BD442|nr:hypothetical protein [Lacrimispora sp.]